MDSLVVALYDTVASMTVLVLAFVVTQAMRDVHLKRIDALPVQKARKNTFYAAMVFIVLTVVFQSNWLWHPTTVVTGLVVSGLLAGAVAILAVSFVSMKHRAPSGPGHASHAARGWQRITRRPF
jgi:hypothetical protein